MMKFIKMFMRAYFRERSFYSTNRISLNIYLLDDLSSTFRTARCLFHNLHWQQKRRKWRELVVGKNMTIISVAE